jgi:hypothetical protein
MKLLFSLATLLICMTVLAVVKENLVIESGSLSSEARIDINRPYWRMRESAEIAIRLAIYGPLSLAATLGVLWTIRRLKSSRHTEPPDGYPRKTITSCGKRESRGPAHKLVAAKTRGSRAS